VPTDGTGQGRGGQATGLLDDPRLLAAGAGGLLAACLALWALRGLPLGAGAFWASPLPLLLAGMGFGPVAAFVAVVVAALTLWLAGTVVGVWVFLLGFGIPALLLVAAWQGPGGQGAGGLARPLALLGLIPAAGILGAAFWLSDTPGGLEGTLRMLAESAIRRFDMPASAGFVSDIVRVKAAAVGFWVAVALLANAWMAGKLLARAGIAPPPAWSTARLPGWYPAAPALALAAWLLAEEGSDAVPLSTLLVLLLPLMLHGLAALHTRTRGRGERPLLLGAVYLSLVILFLPASLAVAGFGAYDLLRRPSSPSSSPRGGSGPGTPPRSQTPS
jgi:hypothetical protein